MHPITVDHKLETIVAYLAKKGCKKIMLFGSYTERLAQEVHIKLCLIEELIIFKEISYEC